MLLIIMCFLAATAAAPSRDATPSRTPSASLALANSPQPIGRADSASLVQARRDLALHQVVDVRDGVASRLAAAEQIRFTSVDLIIDTNDQPLAVYQLEFEASKGDVKIVGIEGSSHPAFANPPYFDPQAMQRERVILAAFNTAGADELPRGKVRIATLHLQITGDVEPAYKVTSTVLATVDGEPIPGAKVTVQTQRVPS